MYLKWPLHFCLSPDTWSWKAKPNYWFNSDNTNVEYMLKTYVNLIFLNNCFIGLYSIYHMIANTFFIYNIQLLLNNNFIKWVNKKTLFLQPKSCRRLHNNIKIYQASHQKRVHKFHQLNRKKLKKILIQWSNF